MMRKDATTQADTGDARAVSRRRAMTATAATATTGALAWGLSAMGAAPAAASDGESTGPFVGSVLNVKDHGATGDGETDDTGALRALIAESAEGDAIYFPPGTYLVSEPLRPKGHQVYFSLTDRAILKARPGVTGFLMFHVRSGPVEFRQLTIDGAREETTAPVNPSTARGIFAQPSDGVIDLVVDSCRIRNAHGDGVRVTGDDPSAPARVLIRATDVENCGMYGLGFRGTSNVRVESSRLAHCFNGMWSHECYDVVVQGATATENERHGIVFVYSQDWHVDNCVASNNGGDRGWGIVAGGNYREPFPPPNNDFSITNNICGSNGAGGISLDPTVRQEKEVIQVQRARVSGNLCQDSGRTHGINLGHARDVVVSDNVCTGNPISGIQVSSSSHVLVQGNTCYGNQWGIGLSSNTEVEAPGHHVIGVNMLYGNEVDLKHEYFRGVYPLTGVRIHGLHGEANPEGNVQANPGTTYERHDGSGGALYVKESGTETTGWIRVWGSRAHGNG